MSATRPTSHVPALAAEPRHPTVVEAFVRSLQDLSDHMLGGRVTVHPPEWRDAATVVPPPPAGGATVACAIACTGELAGPVVLTFEPAAAELLARAFTALPLLCGTSDFADAVGEIGNMVVGSAKARLPHEARISTPTVSIRPAGAVHPAGPAPTAQSPGAAATPPRPAQVPPLGGPTAEPGWRVIPCRTPAGNFEVAVGVRDLRAGDRRAA